MVENEKIFCHSAVFYCFELLKKKSLFKLKKICAVYVDGAIAESTIHWVHKL